MLHALAALVFVTACLRTSLACYTAILELTTARKCSALYEQNRRRRAKEFVLQQLVRVM